MAAFRTAADNGAVQEVAGWFRARGRDLPWRGEHRDAWQVLVSEFMLQQTPVARVVPVWGAWIDRWPTASDLAAEPPAEALRMWGRLGYPRRALRLHAAATAIRDDFGGAVPSSYEELRSLPGVGDYTAAAVLAFAHRRRIPVLDTNVRRVLARVWDGSAYPTGSSASRAERVRLDTALPPMDEDAATLSEGLMELGAVVCTSRNPRCDECPVAPRCSWQAAGRPDNQSPPSRQAPFAGSDRQVRGRILQLVRSTPAAVPQAEIDLTWPDEAQLRRAQRSLLTDGLLVEAAPGRFTLPGA